MSVLDYLLVLLVVALFAAAVWYCVHHRKNGGCAGDCKNCTQCTEIASGCSQKKQKSKNYCENSRLW